MKNKKQPGGNSLCFTAASLHRGRRGIRLREKTRGTPRRASSCCSSQVPTTLPPSLLPLLLPFSSLFLSLRQRGDVAAVRGSMSSGGIAQRSSAVEPRRLQCVCSFPPSPSFRLPQRTTAADETQEVDGEVATAPAPACRPAEQG